MDGGGGSASGSSYYTVLGVRKDVSFSHIRAAYRKLAMKWHPDKWTKNPQVAGEANSRFQQIQEAYSVLSDQGKRSMYDGGIYSPLEEEEDKDFCNFMQEMVTMMNTVKDEGDSFEDLQRMFQDMVGNNGGGDNMGFDLNGTDRSGQRRPRLNVSSRSSSCH